MEQRDSVSVCTASRIEGHRKLILRAEPLTGAARANCHLTAGLATSLHHTVPQTATPPVAYAFTWGFNRKCGFPEDKAVFSIKQRHEDEHVSIFISALSVMAKTETSQMAITR